MSEHMKSKAKNLKVEYIGGNKRHYFRVKSGNKEYDVSMLVGCTCPYMSGFGQEEGEVCSHIQAAMRKIIDNGGIKGIAGEREWQRTIGS